jgi:hypothetical protein
MGMCSADGEFTRADIPELIALLSDRRPSRWEQGSLVRTIGDQALRALAQLLAFDPRVLVARSRTAPWTDDERRATAESLSVWWRTHSAQSCTDLRLMALINDDAW